MFCAALFYTMCVVPERAVPTQRKQWPSYTSGVAPSGEQIMPTGLVNPLFFYDSTVVHLE
jgi:hypothetical protein